MEAQQSPEVLVHPETVREPEPVRISDEEFEQFWARAEKDAWHAADAVIEIWMKRYPSLDVFDKYRVYGSLRLLMLEALQKIPPFEKEHFRKIVAAIIRDSRKEMEGVMTYDELDKRWLTRASMASLSESAVQESIERGSFWR